MASPNKHVYHRGGAEHEIPTELLPPQASEAMHVDKRLPVKPFVEAYLASPDNDRTDMAGLLLLGDKANFRVIDTHTERVEHEQTTRKIKPQPFHKIGRRFSPTLHEEATAPSTYSSKDVVLVEQYDKENDVVSVFSYERNAFYDEVDRAGVNKAFWEPKKSTIEDPLLAIPIDAKPDPKGKETLYAKIAGQLHEQGITSWIGLTWQQDGHTRKIVHDTSAKERLVDGHQWVRTFSILDIAPDGTETYLNAPITRKEKINIPIAKGETRKLEDGFRDYELLNFLADDKNNGPITNMRMPQKPEWAKSAEMRSRGLYRYAGFLAAPEFVMFESPEEIKRREKLERKLDKEYREATDSILLKHIDEAKQPERKPALWLLGHPDVLERHESLSKMTKITESRHQQSGRRLEAIETAIKGEGLVSVYTLANDLRNEMLQGMKKLGMLDKVRGDDRSLSWIVEGIADSMLEGGDPFASSNSGQLDRLKIIDSRVGELFMGGLTERHKVPEPFVKDGEQKVREANKLLLDGNHSLLRDIRAEDKADDPRVVTQGIAYGPLRDQVRQLYEKLSEDKKVTEEEYAKIGRMARARIGQ